MNNLKRDIKSGEIVIIKASVITPEAIQRLGGDLRWVATGGFGMRSFTIGSALTGYWKADAEANPDVPPPHYRMEGHDIDVAETQRYQADPVLWLAGREHRLKKLLEQKQSEATAKERRKKQRRRSRS